MNPLNPKSPVHLSRTAQILQVFGAVFISSDLLGPLRPESSPSLGFSVDIDTSAGNLTFYLFTVSCAPNLGFRVDIGFGIQGLAEGGPK